MFSFFKKRVQPLPGEIEEAKKWPNGQIYRIKGNFKAEEAVPPQAIIGAWKVDGNGRIIEKFIPNPNFDPNFKKG
jgi:hypothetical protein